jgi:DNA-binding transcriptional ArsR family regulator
MDSNINIGDAFVGGLYLSKDNALIIQYPSGYVLEQVTPAPDQNRDGLTWYGLRSFGAGEPRVILAKASFPWIPLILGFIIVSAGVILYVARKRKDKSDSNLIVTEKVSETELMDLEDRILKLLKESDGSLYQSEIGKKLDLPKSTVSSALNELSNKNLIQKIKKGRENLIRLS